MATTLNLSLSNAYNPPHGQSLVIIDNDEDDAISGSFANASGADAHPRVSGTQWDVNYTGGDGNDVELMFDALADEHSDLAVTADAAFANASNVSAFPFTVAGLDADATAVVTFSDGNAANDQTFDVSADGSYSVDLSGLNEATITISITATDNVGNSASGLSDSAIKDTTADDSPHLELTVPAATASFDGLLELSGIDADIVSAVITLTDGGSPANVATYNLSSAQIASGDMSTTIEQFSGFLELLTGTLNVSVSVSDEAGNSTGQDLDSSFAFVAARDYGDAPDSYATRVSSDGARHKPVGPRLGDLRDIESDGQPAAGADGDDAQGSSDEDGVTWDPIAAGLFGATITIDVQNATYAYADAWIDFDGNGTFDNNEQILTSAGVISGSNVLLYDVSALAVPGDTYARVRLSSTGGLGPAGFAADGEVEDYRVKVLERVALDLSGGGNDITIRQTSGGELEVYDDAGNASLLTRPLDEVYSLTVHGSETESDVVTVDFHSHGFFALPGGMELNGGGNAGDALTVSGTTATRADYSMAVSPLGQTLLVVSQDDGQQTILYSGYNDWTFQNLLSFAAHSVLNVGSREVTIDSIVPVNLSSLTTLAGGTLAANNLSLGSGEAIVGHGAIDARFSGEVGSLIQLSGDLSIGDSASPAGFSTRGDVEVRDHALTLLDANQAVLGALTTLGQASVPGTLAAANGLLVDFGNNVVGFGTLDTPNEVTKPLLNNGTISGNSATEQITLPGWARGVGSKDHVIITGTDDPGFSPATVYNGSMVYGSSSTTIIEIGGVTPGSGGHDQLRYAGSVTLNGTLDVRLINDFEPSTGSTFLIMTTVDGVLGAFSDVLLPLAPSGSEWFVRYEPNHVQLELVDLAEVASVVMGHGGNAQRSLVSEIQVTFDGQVDVDEDAFVLIKRGTDGGTVTTTPALSTDASGNTVATLSFSGELTRGALNALVDGNYQLSVDATKVRRAGTTVQLDGNGNGKSGGSYHLGTAEVDDFFAYYGDTDGDRDVDGSDFGVFRAGFFNPPNYTAIVDYDGDADIDGADFGEFRKRFFVTFPFE